MSGKIETRYEMVRAGYKYKSHAACKGCGARIEWWKTNNGKLMPFDPIADDNVKTVPHWTTCPKRDKFKSKADVAKDARVAREQGARDLLEKTKARAVIALYDDGLNALSWRNGILAEDLKHEAITAANKLRWNVITAGGKA